MTRNGNIYVTPTNGGSVNLLPGNPRRRFIRLSHSSSGGVYFQAEAMTAAGQGIFLSPGSGVIQQTIILSYDDVGEMLTGPWFAWCVNSVGVIAVVEGFEYD